MVHKNIVFGSTCGNNKHKQVLAKLIREYCLSEHHSFDAKFVGLSLASVALAFKERSHMPMVGCSVDRRFLNGVGEVVNKFKLRVLMCFICACKHVEYSGYDMFGNAANKGRISD
eukprot:6018412-Karenia_brevis.AAC.1